MRGVSQGQVVAPVMFLIDVNNVPVGLRSYINAEIMKEAK